MEGNDLQCMDIQAVHLLLAQFNCLLSSPAQSFAVERFLVPFIH
jgi:hypothetical protein